MTRDEMDQEANRLLHIHNDNERKIACLGGRLERISVALSGFLSNPEASGALDPFQAIAPSTDVAANAAELAAALRERQRLTARLSKEFPYLFGSQ